MKFLQALVFRLVFLGILAVGVLLALFELHEIYDFTIRYLPSDEYIRWGVAIGAIIVGIAGLVFGWRGRRKSRTIEFQSRHGYIVIELDSVQKSLQKAMAKLPEVKDISLQVHPSEHDRKVRIIAEAAVIKPPGVGIRETVSQLYDKLDQSAKQMLGVDDIASLDLRISRTVMNVKEEFDNLDKSRLLEHKAAPAPAAAPTPATEAAPSPVAQTPSPAANPAPATEPPSSESSAGMTPADSNSREDKPPEPKESDEEPAKGFWR